MVINVEQKKIHFDVRFILTYNIYSRGQWLKAMWLCSYMAMHKGNYGAM